jgi:3-deoxy-7-phosphoheptulonate synthase
MKNTYKKNFPSPEQIKKDYPLLPHHLAFIAKSRQQCAKIVRQEHNVFAAIVGPCSIHDFQSAIEYATRLKKLSSELSDSIFLTMRCFIEKPRTRFGWKGLLYDPFLDGSNEIEEGIRQSRKLFLALAELQVPCACELLEPLAVEYFDDLISWGFIGARTSASQPHRQFASGLPFPVGFKNGIHGEIDVAISAVLSAHMPHSYLGLDEQGKISAISSSGNPLAHIVLRGSETATNFDPASLEKIIYLLKAHQLDPVFLIDCGHGNSKKNYTHQAIVFQSAIQQLLEGNSSILGIMLESHLSPGKQPLLENPKNLSYGMSITDSCLGWEETKNLLLWADRLLSIHFNQLGPKMMLPGLNEKTTGCEHFNLIR